MEVRAKTRYLRMSARKVRLVADLIRGLDVAAALDQLKVMTKHAKTPIEKLLLSAVANAEHNFRLDKDALKVSQIMVDKGMDLKRWRPRAFGRAAPIKKHSCHITIVLSEKDKDKGKDKKEEKGKKEIKEKKKSVKVSEKKEVKATA